MVVEVGGKTKSMVTLNCSSQTPGVFTRSAPSTYVLLSRLVSKRNSKNMRVIICPDHHFTGCSLKCVLSNLIVALLDWSTFFKTRLGGCFDRCECCGGAVAQLFFALSLSISVQETALEATS
jgi:hypothetical protein